MIFAFIQKIYLHYYMVDNRIVNLVSLKKYFGGYS